MKLQTIVLAGLLALAALPVAAQQKPDPVVQIKVAVVTHTVDPTVFPNEVPPASFNHFVSALTKKITDASTDNVQITVVNEKPKTDDPSEYVFALVAMSGKNADGPTSVISLVAMRHVQTLPYPFYLFSTVFNLNDADIDSETTSVVETLAAIDEFGAGDDATYFVTPDDSTPSQKKQTAPSTSSETADSHGA